MSILETCLAHPRRDAATPGLVTSRCASFRETNKAGDAMLRPGERIPNLLLRQLLRLVGIDRKGGQERTAVAGNLPRATQAIALVTGDFREHRIRAFHLRKRRVIN